MTESLTERLQKKLSSQTAEIEAMTSAELKQLAASLRQQSENELRTMQNAIQGVNLSMTKELRILRQTGRWWWIALAVTWMMVAGLSVWHSMRSDAPGIEQFQSFTKDGRTILLLPDGTEAMTCYRTGSTDPLRCAALPTKD
ncbi:hypothetical protein [Falsirhodobacter sp. 1013]|uniref:hypothetical protein n=1 Tax=Falsirhodobacter sp. 1013 TaxID=3417566 RepID=UPI003EBC1C59